MTQHIPDLFNSYMEVTGNFSEAAASLTLAHVIAEFLDGIEVRDEPTTPKAVPVKVKVNGEPITDSVLSETPSK